MPSSRLAKKAILDAIPSQALTIYELGSGWGGLCLALAKAHPKASIHAFELSPLPWLISLFFKKILGYKNLKIYRKNFFSVSLAPADVIVCYLFPGAMLKLKPKFEQELEPKTHIITNSFSIPCFIPHRSEAVQDIWRSEIFIYIT